MKSSSKFGGIVIRRDTHAHPHLQLRASMPMVPLQDGRNEPVLVGGILDRYRLDHEHPRARLEGEHVHAIVRLCHTRPCQRKRQRWVPLPPPEQTQVVAAKAECGVGGGANEVTQGVPAWRLTQLKEGFSFSLTSLLRGLIAESNRCAGIGIARCGYLCSSLV